MESSQPDDTSLQSAGRPAGPCVIVIFGASGDLTRRKLIPALANLARENLLPTSLAIVGVATRPWSNDDFRENVRAGLKEHATEALTDELQDWFAERLYYLSGDFKSADTYSRLRQLLNEIDERHQTAGNRLYYLAAAPGFFSEIPQQLQKVGLTQETDDCWRRVVVEKPFGNDLESARELNRQLRDVLTESQIYRIDHYLGKETVQNILALRFANGIFEPVWNRRYVDHVQITVAESIGVEKRGRYYDKSGALRDMVPNHIFQLITLTAMEPPISFDADAVRDEQVKILKAIQPLTEERALQDTVRGQYGEGIVGGEPAVAYRDEEHVDPQSETPTYVAMKLFIDNWRWSGIPFYLRTGKSLTSRTTEIAVRFKRAPFSLFRDSSVDHLDPNWLLLRLQPDEGISLRFGAKVPGAVMRLGNVDMDFNYKDYFGSKPQTGYERLLYECMLGDATLFQRADMVEASWDVVAPVLAAWSATEPDCFPNYAAGSWGPVKAENLLAQSGHNWQQSD